ncbi:MAG: glycosyltransferase family 61 protein [Gloeocapsa sp. DLM2.Bin57]|nr:MAG: glycosyltransferase family 61 protein [Gloeocapsa sp. DLM2.Bin57]
MQQINKTSNIIPEEILQVPGSKTFSYSTYLADAFEAGILDIYRPQYQVPQAEINYEITEGTTESLNHIQIKDSQKWLNRKALLSKITKQIKPALKITDNRVFFDARYVFTDNVAHMIINVMPIAVHIARRTCPNINVILPENPKKFTLKVCELMGIPTLVTNQEVEGKLITFKNFQNSVVPDKFYRSTLELYDEVLAEKIDQLEYPTYKRVFIGRKGTRNITNEPEVEALLKEYGFTKVYYEDIPMEQQWLISKQAEVIVGIHGAAFGALMFNRAKVKVIEIFHPGYVVRSIRNITACVGGTWCGITGKLPDPFSEAALAANPREFAEAAMTVDVQSVKMALDYMAVEK